MSFRVESFKKMAKFSNKEVQKCKADYDLKTYTLGDNNIVIILEKKSNLFQNRFKHSAVTTPRGVKLN